MKNVVVSILLLWGSISYSQDTIKIPQVELDNFFKAVDTLRFQDSLKTVLIQDLENQIYNYNLLSKKDSLIISYKKEEIKLINEQIILYDRRLNEVDKWYKKPWVGYIAGIASTILTIHIINYTLP
tara:strand:- start:34 stop:411 length:378 start_codon:yes stop_codon:yes gene_type:complete